MEKVKNFFGKCKSAVVGAAVAGTTALVASPASAAIDLTGVTVDTSDYVAIATFLVGALVSFWGIKKAIALIGR